jgi:peptidoglycan/xylan/chitin deacetylase (PgdA/CDA1 family)
MLTVQVPQNYQAERKYILSVLLGEFLGLEFQVQHKNTDGTVIIGRGDERQLVIADCLFACSPEKWLKPDSLPLQPLKIWNIDIADLEVTTVDRYLPIIYGIDVAHPNFFLQSENRIDLGLDIFGSAFFMLTRYEEVVKPDRDQFDRFPASASLAYQEGFLDRPIVNEYLEVLWACLNAWWPKLSRKQRHFTIYVSHDIDEPFRFAFTGVPRLMQRCAGDLLYRKSLSALLSSIDTWKQVTFLNRTDLDPCNTFDLIMDISEKHNLKSAFYFITDHTAGAIDGVYSIDHPLIRQLLRKIHARGHEIGLHPSYNTYLNAAQTKKEFEILKRVCAEEGIYQQTWGGRQHYLRWHTPTTFQNWDKAGLNYDSTLAYADRIGFRCGTCYDFSVFDLATRVHLSLKELPLTIMDVTIAGKSYMSLDITSEKALLLVTKIKSRCKQFEGNFTLLWHNTTFISSEGLMMYLNVLSSS